MKYNKRITSLLLGVASLSLTMSAIAADNIEIKHAITASQTNSVSFSFIIDNPTAESLVDATLIPMSNELELDETNSLITIGNLPSMGQAVVEWTFTTSVDASYFQSGMPLFFIIEAKNINGDYIEMPVYSSRSTAL